MNYIFKEIYNISELYDEEYYDEICEKLNFVLFLYIKFFPQTINILNDKYNYSNIKLDMEQNNNIEKIKLYQILFDNFFN